MDAIYRDNGFAALKKDVEEMHVTANDLKSITVGINLNERFEAISLGLISVNRKPFTRSGLLKNFISSVSPRDDIQEEADWNNSYSYFPANADGGIFSGMGHMMETAMVMRNPIAALSMARIFAVAASPSISGIRISMRIAS